MTDLAHLMETPVESGTVFKCTREGCGGEVQVTKAPHLDARQPYTCCCGGEMEQVSTTEAIAGG